MYRWWSQFCISLTNDILELVITEAVADWNSLLRITVILLSLHTLFLSSSLYLNVLQTSWVYTGVNLTDEHIIG